MTPFADSIFEDAVFAWLEGMGWPVAHGPDIVADMLLPSVSTPMKWYRSDNCVTRRCCSKTLRRLEKALHRAAEQGEA